jgi:DNA-directed RNA polymerase specialized sigma24 family protein
LARINFGNLSPESFDAMLSWLDPYRERAGHIYEEIRQRLIKLLVRRGCDLAVAEELTDEAIDRVCRKVPAVAPTYSGDPASYFYRFAINVHLEYLKRQRGRPKTLPPPDQVESVERMHDCLEECLAPLEPDNRGLLIEYYRYEKRAKIECHDRMAAERGISKNTLRNRVFKMKRELKVCVEECLNRNRDD